MKNALAQQSLLVSVLISPAIGQTVFAADNLGEFNGGGTGDRIIVFDVSDPGTVTELGYTGVGGTLMSGLDFGPGGVLYAYSRDPGGGGSGELYTIDQTTGAATLVGSGGVQPGDRINDMSWSETDQKMYAIGELRGGSVNLYEVDLASGVVSVNATLTDTTGAVLIVGFAIDPSTNDMYVHDIVSDRIYIRVGSALQALPNVTGYDGNFSQGMTFDPNSGTLYMGTWKVNTGFPRSDLRIADTATGIATSLGFIGPLNVGHGIGEYEPGDIAIAKSDCPDAVYCDTNPDNSADISVDNCSCASGSINISLSGAVAPDGNFGYLLVGQGTTPVTDPPGAQGDLCLVGSPIGRFNKGSDIKSITGGSAGPLDVLNAFTAGGGGNIPTIGGNLCAPLGQTWNFQWWYRNGMNPSRFSKAVTVTFN